MAEAYLRFFSEGSADVYSAGTHPQAVHPMAIQILKEDGIDMSHHRSKSIEEYFDFVITVCNHALESCPAFPSTATKVHHDFPDPALFKGSEQEIKNYFREIRDSIKAFCKDFVMRNLL